MGCCRRAAASGRASVRPGRRPCGRTACGRRLPPEPPGARVPASEPGCGRSRRGRRSRRRGAAAGAAGAAGCGGGCRSRACVPERGCGCRRCCRCRGAAAGAGCCRLRARDAGRRACRPRVAGTAARRRAGAALGRPHRRSVRPAAFADGNDSRRRRATGASTVEDADFTNSPCSLSVASSSLLVTPSSLANSCTRALPATALLTDEVERGCPQRAPARPRVISDGRSSLVLHGVLMSACACLLERYCSVCVKLLDQWSTADVSSCPDTRSALPNARRRSAQLRQFGSGCSHAPRPGSLRRGSGTSGHPAARSSRTTTLQQIGGRLTLPAPDACSTGPA